MKPTNVQITANTNMATTVSRRAFVKRKNIMDSYYDCIDEQFCNYKNKFLSKIGLIDK